MKGGRHFNNKTVVLVQDVSYLITFPSVVFCSDSTSFFAPFLSYSKGVKEADVRVEEDDGSESPLIRKKEKQDGLMSDDEVDSALRKLCKCNNPFKRYARIKEVGAG